MKHRNSIPTMIVSDIEIPSTSYWKQTIPGRLSTRTFNLKSTHAHHNQSRPRDVWNRTTLGQCTSMRANKYHQTIVLSSPRLLFRWLLYEAKTQMAHNAPNAWRTVKETINKRREIKRFQGEGVETIINHRQETRSYFGLGQFVRI